ncbi:MAG: hypothetical protein QM755_03100 [Luteolibacter sp.]
MAGKNRVLEARLWFLIALGAMIASPFFPAWVWGGKVVMGSLQWKHAYEAVAAVATGHWFKEAIAAMVPIVMAGTALAAMLLVPALGQTRILLWPLRIMWTGYGGWAIWMMLRVAWASRDRKIFTGAVPISMEASMWLMILAMACIIIGLWRIPNGRQASVT